MHKRMAEPLIAVRYNRRVNLKNISQMNGDNLPALKRVPKGEIGSGVVSYNAATNRDMTKQLNLWFKEQNIAISNLKKKQAAVYKSMCHVHQEQKKLLRKKYREEQEKSRRIFLGRNSLEQRATVELEKLMKRDIQSKSKRSLVTTDDDDTRPLDNKHPNVHGIYPVTVLPDIKGTSSGSKEKESSSGGNKNHLTIYDQQAIASDKTNLHQQEKTLVSPLKSKVMEVKRDGVKTMTREKRLRHELGELKIPSRNKKQPPPLSYLLENLEKPGEHSAVDEDAIGTVAQVNKSDNHDSRQVSSPVLSTIDEHSSKGHKNVSPDIQHKQSYNRMDIELDIETNRLLTPSRRGSFSSVASKAVSLSNVKLNKIRARRKEEKIKMELSKPFPVYDKDNTGQFFVKEVGVKREVFKPPSNKPQYQLDKVMREQYAKNMDVGSKLRDFNYKYKKEEDDLRGELAAKRLAIEKMHQAEQENKKEIKRNEKGSGLTANVAYTAFLQKNLSEAGIVPNSFEAIQKAMYLRRYDTDEAAKIRLNRKGKRKVTSWNRELPLPL